MSLSVKKISACMQEVAKQVSVVCLLSVILSLLLLAVLLCTLTQQLLFCASGEGLLDTCAFVSFTKLSVIFQVLHFQCPSSVMYRVQLKRSHYKLEFLWDNSTFY